MEMRNFLGGLWLPSFFGDQAPANGLLAADNIEYMPSGAVRGRRGRVLYGTVPAKAVSLWRHYPRTGSPAFLAAYDDGISTTIRHDTASNGTFAVISGSPTFATGKRFFFTNWATTPRGVFRLGLKQGLFCLGCCWAMMAVMFAVGLMNVVWMAGLGIVMTLEKLGTGRAFTYTIGVVLIVAGVAFIITSFLAHWPVRAI